MESIKARLGEDWNILLSGIKQYLSSDIALLNAVNDNLLSNSGKQLRPLLALLVARAISGSVNEDTIRYAVASELLHNATLLHDDVADQSDQRRGRPTLRALMGPESSVLVGDYWLSCAMKAIMDSSVGRDRCLGIFSQTLMDLASGEMFQLEKAGACDTVFDDYLTIIYRKTGSLFVSSAQAAAISVGASEVMEKAAADYARYIGYAFQMRDDIFDYDGDAAVGKPLGVDILEKKITLPLLGALANVTEDEEARVRGWIRDNAVAARDEIADFTRRNGGIEYAQRVLNEYIGKAIDALSAFPPSEERDMLAKLAGFIAVRSK